MPNNILTMDFGTSNTLVGANVDGDIHAALPLDPGAQDPTVIRSLLFFPSEDEVYYGSEAVSKYEEFAFEGRFIKSIKKFLPQESYLGSHIENRLVRLEDLISYFLLEMKKRAEEKLNQTFESIILGRPAKYSHDIAKDNVAMYRMTKAAELAGFKNIELVPEPLAAAHDFRAQLEGEKNVLVVDLGGGTSDFTIVRMSKNKFSRSDVLAITGVPVAGDKFDGAIMQHKLAPLLGSEVTYKVPLGSNVMRMPASLLEHICSPGDLTQLRRKDFYQFFVGLKNWNVSVEDRSLLENLEIIVDENLGFQIFDCIEKSKVDVNTHGFSELFFKYADMTLAEPMKLNDFEAFTMTQTSKIFEELDECLKLAGLNYSDIDYIHCTGGTSKLNIIQSKLKKLFTESKVQTGNEFGSVLSGLTEYSLSL